MSAGNNQVELPGQDGVHICNNEHRISSVELKNINNAPTPFSKGISTRNTTKHPADFLREPLIVHGTETNSVKERTGFRDEQQSRTSDSIFQQVSRRSSGPTWLPPSYTFDGLFTNWWLWELSSWLVATASVVIMITVLHNYDHEVPPNWSYGVTINTAVSVLATILKVCLMCPVAEAIGQLKWLWYATCNRQSDFGMFDEASRGPTGAIQLFARTKGRSVSHPIAPTVDMIAYLVNQTSRDIWGTNNPSGSWN